MAQLPVVRVNFRFTAASVSSVTNHSTCPQSPQTRTMACDGLKNPVFMIPLQ
ncbi:hypothetical protein [Haloferula sp. BvORR071]|uniref:hypothetical protein n=1 Tax=Haloferula sp. BvORR071 TaxID=1396141 RepID=UPI002240F6DB|nr:hypothetical protein [Haloferula sp. BvORR071]